MKISHLFLADTLVLCVDKLLLLLVMVAGAVGVDEV